MGKKAVVLCGGGAKGAYQIGALKALKKIGYKYDIVTGTSVGALNGAFAVMNDIKKAEKIWSDIDMKKIFSFNEKQKDISKAKSMTDLTTNLIKSGSSASYEPLLNLIKENVNEKKIRKSNIDYGFITTRFSPLKKVEIYKEDIPRGQINSYIMASAACYPYMKSYKINNTMYIDGGYFDNMPIDMAIKKGASDIVVIDLKGIGKVNKQNDLSAKITYVSTNYDLGGIMIFDKENSKRNIKLGYLDTLKAFNKLDGHLYAFKKGETIKASRLENKMIDLFRSIFVLLPNSSTLETLAENSIRKNLNDYQKDLFKIKSNVLSSLEFAATIFNIDYLNEYTFTSLGNKVILEYNKYKKENEESLDIKKALNEVLKVEKLKDIFKLYDKRSLVIYLKNIIDKETMSADDKKDIYMFSIAFPDAVLAALFIKNYEENKIMTKK